MAVSLLSLVTVLTLPFGHTDGDLDRLRQLEEELRLQIVVEVVQEGSLAPDMLTPLLEVRAVLHEEEARRAAAAVQLARPAREVWSGTPGVEQWRPLVAAHFPASQVDTAMRVMACESGGNPSAKNPTSTAAGLFQFLRSTWDWVAGVLGFPSYDQGGPYDPQLAVPAAAWLQANGGWQHWVCY